jgi:transcriptional regulator with XRE-family HTH domain
MSQFFDSSRDSFKILTQGTLGLGVARAFGHLLKQLHESRDWSLRDLAARYDAESEVGTVVSYLSKIINAKVAPKPAVINRLADVLSLEGRERERFVFLGLLAKAPQPIEARMLALEESVAQMRRELGLPP